MAKNGFVIAGNLIVDKVKMIDNYPKSGMLTNITEIVSAVGGAVPNTGIDLKIIDSDLRVSALGCVGADAEGEFIINTLKKFGLETKDIKSISTFPTSFTDVMTVKETGERTFFHNKGANKEFFLSDKDINSLSCDIFHIGYILLLDKLDGADDEFGTAMARLLKKVQDRGIKTSIDVVSEDGDRFSRTVTPALKYVNYCIINEVEAGAVCGVCPRDNNGKINVDNIKEICKKLFSLGVKDKVVIHCPEFGFSMDNRGNFVAVGSLNLPKGYIQGTVGAGDAFCAGALYSIYNNFQDEQLLKFASLCSACNLSKPDSISGMRSYKETIKLEEMFSREKN